MAQASPQRESGVEESASALRVALPLMTRHQIPTTPENYAVWFHYVCKDRPGLNEYIDKYLELETAFTPEVNDHIYRQFLSDCDLQQAEKVRRSIASALAEVAITLRQTDGEADRYSQALNKFDKSCESAESLSDIYGLLHMVMEETKSMQQSMQQLQQEFTVKSKDMDKLRQELDQVRKQASTDALTGLFNRTTFFNTMEEIDTESNPLSNPYCVVMIDIDQFKRVNDTFGHLVGDKVIRFVADTLRQSTKGQDCAARYGGEEYALILPNTCLENAVTLCDKIREYIAKTALVRTGTRESLGQITVSAGVAQNRSGESRMNLLARADKALYQAKKNGRNRVVASID